MHLRLRLPRPRQEHFSVQPMTKKVTVGASHASAAAVAEAKARALQRSAHHKEGNVTDDDSSDVRGGSIRLRAGDADNAPGGHVFIDAGVGDAKAVSTSSVASSARRSVLQGSSSGRV